MTHIQGNPGEIHELAGALPKCLAPVEFTEYRQVDANASFRRL